MRTLTEWPEVARGAGIASRWQPATGPVHHDPGNPLSVYFDGITEGPGVWKWQHYFDVYHRHLQKFVGREVTVVEVGVYSGGSMRMWRHYFGEGCHVHGVDIEDACKVYENAHTTIHVGDQADRAFWQRFREAVPAVDVLIDDGGHLPEQQMVTLEEMLPHLKAGGVYICEDVHGVGHQFSACAHGLADGLNAVTPGPEAVIPTTPFQAAVHSVHLYPFLVVIEKRDALLTGLTAPKRGTEWQPFFDRP